MVDIADEVNTDYYQRVGKLVCLLAEHKDSFVRVQKADSILADNMLTVRITRMKQNKSVSVQESFTHDMLLHVSDMKVVADAIIQQLERVK